MENFNNSDQQMGEQTTGGPLEGMSPQFTNMPPNDTEADNVVYANLGIDGEPDVMNPGSEEATDTLLYTDNAVAADVSEGIGNVETDDTLPPEFYNDLGNVSEARLEAEMDMLDEEEKEV
jgi:hypothetical protein